jgi:hypothetical protein
MLCHVTHNKLPTSVFSTASPPPGTLFATSTAAADATTYTMPMNASWGTRLLRPEVRVNANRNAPIAVARSAKKYVAGESGATWNSSADRLPSAAICARDRSTKITSRAITCRPR